MSDQETKTKYRERDGINISMKTIVSAVVIALGGIVAGGAGGMQIGNGNNSQYVIKSEYIKEMSTLRLEIKDSVHRIELQMAELLRQIQDHDRKVQ